MLKREDAIENIKEVIENLELFTPLNLDRRRKNR
jgi:hypothetical protein